MDFLLLVHRIKERLKQPLPGESAQFKMAPALRLTIKEYYQQAERNPRESAVLICIYPFKGSVYTVLMLRPTEKGAHSNQVSFPGGRFEKLDSNLQNTALREAKEELGIDPDKVELIGELSSVYIPVSNSLVHPFIGILMDRPSFTKSDFEVEEIIEIDLALFADPRIIKTGQFSGLNNLQIEAPYFDLHDQKIWGATAMILSELLVVLHP